MTICVSVKSRDGVILGTDSMTMVNMTLTAGQSANVKSYHNAKKLYQVGALPIGVMTWGIGNIGSRTIYGLIQEFNRRDPDQNVEQVANDLYAFIRGIYDTEFANVADPQKQILGLWIAGYSENSPFPEEWEFVLPTMNAPIQSRPPNQFGASWRGISLPFTRLHSGFDPRIIGYLQNAGVANTVIEPLLQGIYQSRVLVDPMPVQDAINFAVYVLRTTIGFASFEVGQAPCGGPLQLSAITHENGFIWIKESKLKIQEDFYE